MTTTLQILNLAQLKLFGYVPVPKYSTPWTQAIMASHCTCILSCLDDCNLTCYFSKFFLCCRSSQFSTHNSQPLDACNCSSLNMYHQQKLLLPHSKLPLHACLWINMSRVQSPVCNGVLWSLHGNFTSSDWRGADFRQFFLSCGSESVNTMDLAWCCCLQRWYTTSGTPSTINLDATRYGCWTTPVGQSLTFFLQPLD